MSITDELREYANTRISPNKGMLTAIADRIDAEHERAVCDARHDALYGANESDMADLGWVRLPKDSVKSEVLMNRAVLWLIVGILMAHTQPDSYAWMVNILPMLFCIYRSFKEGA